MYYLVFVQIAHHAEQLTEKTVGILAIAEIVGMVANELAERLTIDIVHQDAVVGLGCIVYQMGMVETVACLELLLQSSDIPRICTQFRLQPFQEVQFTIHLHTKALAGGAAYLQPFGMWKHLLTFGKRRSAIHVYAITV